LILGLSGCIARDEPDDLTAEANLAPPPPTFSAADSSEAVRDNWITNFNDPTLLALVEEALAHNHNLAISAARLDQAAAEARIAGAKLVPWVSASGSGQRASGAARMPNTTDTGTDFGVGLSVSWELDLWGRIRAGASAGQAAFDAASFDYLAARNSLAAQVAKAWYAAIEANLQTQLARDIVIMREQMLRAVEHQVRIGKNSPDDRLLIQADLANDRERLASLEAALGNATRSLEVLLGRYPATELTIADHLPKLAPQPATGVPSVLLERRPDLRAAERRIAVAFNLTEQARAARLPRFSLTASGGGTSDDLSNLLSGDSQFWSIGSNFLGPIFQGGRLKAQVEARSAQQDQTLLRYGSLALNAFREIEDAIDQDKASAQRERELAEAWTNFAEAARIAVEQYKVGKTDILSTMLIQERAITGRTRHLHIQALRILNRIDLHLALGGDFSTPPPAGP
jgi:NodT family efflux transporter outer membrane factor (OMF) lipoprotein